MTEMSAAMREFAQRAGAGGLLMQACTACGAIEWPPRDVCRRCWSDSLQWTPVNAAGVVIATTMLHASMEDFFRARLPWRVGTIRLAAGPVAYAHLHRALAEGDAARIEAHLDFKGRGVLVALPVDAGEIDQRLSELTSTTEG